MFVCFFKIVGINLYIFFWNDFIVYGFKDSDGYYIVIFYVNLKYVCIYK